MTAALFSQSPVISKRVKTLNKLPRADGRYVLYWMQQSQRAQENPALELAVFQADQCRLPLVVGFGFWNQYPRANSRHLTFMAEGLAQVEHELAARGIGFVIRPGRPDQVALEMSREAAAVVCDRGYLPIQKQWRENLAQNAGRLVLEVEGDAVVPVNLVSDKAEYAARTIRPKLMRLADDFLAPPVQKTPDRPFNPEAPGMPGGLSPGSAEIKRLISLAPENVKPVTFYFKGGGREAAARFSRFLNNKLNAYGNDRDLTPSAPVSGLSPYLHFGQISPVFMAREIRKQSGEGAEAFFEQLVVRRELAINFVEHSPSFRQYGSVPKWARKTLEKHAKDPRSPLYGKEELEAAKTHDPFWNGAMEEMKTTGYLHNRMRMYWGKKILQWSPDPEEAHRLLLKLNDAYFLDGRDPNSYAGVGWVFGLHDRPWKERPIFGTVRYMAASGLKRKCDMKAYLGYVQAL